MINFIIRKSVNYSVQIIFLMLIIFIAGLNITEDRINVITGINNPTKQESQEFAETFQTDSNLIIQFFAFAKQKLSGNLGVSQYSNRLITEEIKELAPISLELLLYALLISLIMSSITSCFYYLITNKKIKQSIEGATLIGNSIPLYIMIITVNFLLIDYLDFFYITDRINSSYELTKITGMITIDSFLAKDKYGLDAFISSLKNIAMPVILISCYQFSIITRNMIEQINIVASKNYIKAALARGEIPFSVLINHILPNTKYAIFKDIILSVKDYITLVVIAEFIFCWPGLGSWIVNAVIDKNYNLILDGIFVLSMTVITFKAIAEFMLKMVTLNQNKEL